MSEPLVRVENLKVRVPDRTLKDSVSFEVAPASAVRITGRNGTGKTTLIRQVLGLRPRPVGVVRYGFPMVLGDTVGYFPQEWTETLLPWLDAWGNVLVGLLNTQRVRFTEPLGRLVRDFFPEEAAAASAAIGSSDGVCNGVAKQLAQRPVGELSGGQKEKLVLLRTLACTPQLVFLDEPYRDLDSVSTQALNKYLREAVCEQNGGVVYVSHQDVGIPASFTLNMD